MPISPYNVKQGNAYQQPVQVVSADGAITLESGVAVITKGTAATITIADPPAANNGAVIVIVSTTAAAHTVSNAAGSGFNGGGSSTDVGTFGAAAGNGFSLVAYGGEWLVIPGSNLNVTLG